MRSNEIILSWTLTTDSEKCIRVMRCAVVKFSIDDPDGTSAESDASGDIQIVAYSAIKETFPALYETYKDSVNAIPTQVS